jgi:hypothetical protein
MKMFVVVSSTSSPVIHVRSISLAVYYYKGSRFHYLIFYAFMLEVFNTMRKALACVLSEHGLAP